jgi:hypothetical protein
MSSKKRDKKLKGLVIYDREKIRPGNPETVVFTSRIVDNCTGNISGTPYVSTSNAYDGNYEYLKYKVCSRKPYGIVLPCLHVKNEVTFGSGFDAVSYATVALHNCSPSGKANYTYQDTRTNQAKYPFPDGYRLPDLPSTACINQCHREALEFFASGCQPIEANWAVNLTELGELVTLVKDAGLALVNLKRAFFNARLPVSWRNFIKQLSRGDLPAAWAISGELASAHLTWAFAISPLISDIKKTIEVIKSAERRVKWLIYNNNRPVPVSFTKVLSSEYPIAGVTFPAMPASSELFGSQVFRTFYSANYKAFGTATYDVSGLSESSIAKKLLKQAFGFNDPLVFLWEKIPFSFVLDWFVDVGGYIASLPSKSVFPYVLGNTGYSIYVSQANTRTNYGWKSSSYTPRQYWLGIRYVEYLTYYKRTPIIPVTLSGIDTSLPGVDQLLLAMSLGRKIFFSS